MIIKKARLEKAIEDGELPYKVKELFRDYVEAYKRLRKTTKEYEKDFADTYIKYDNYLENVRKKQNETNL